MEDSVCITSIIRFSYIREINDADPTCKFSIEALSVTYHLLRLHAPGTYSELRV